MPTIRVIIIDDHSIVREGIRMIIENDDEMKVVGEAENMRDALNAISRERPDIVLLDLDLGKELSINYISDIFSACADSKVLILTGVIDEELHKRAMLDGARGILLKNQAGPTLLKAIKKVQQGEAWVDRTLTIKLLAEANKTSQFNRNEQKKINMLTLRECEIIKLIAEGLVNKEIAKRLFVAEKTIRNHLTVIYSKLEVSSRLELAIYAARHMLEK
jgi:two-component system, NarL family, response regulator DegU